MQHSGKFVKRSVVEYEISVGFGAVKEMKGTRSGRRSELSSGAVER